MDDCFSPLLDIIYSGSTERWKERNEKALDALFGTPHGRYHAAAAKSVKLRAPEMKDAENVPFAAYIHPSNPDSGAYGGMSFVIFPVKDAPCLAGLVAGTQGLAPDESILGRPGHARKARAICEWLNACSGGRDLAAWAKQDPTRTDIAVPDDIQQTWSAYQPVFSKYGRVLYAMFRPPEDRAWTRRAVAALLDLMFQERGFAPLARSQDDASELQRGWFNRLMPSVAAEDLASLLSARRYVILEGPPGTGKTMLAQQLLRDVYGGNGASVQFHPSTTYENFIGGLAPVSGNGAFGFSFKPQRGFLMESAAAALANPAQNYLLHIDEINRADLGRVLGEAIYLLEPESPVKREIRLPYDFGPPFGSTLHLPPNLHILGTMNSADRSIAIVDIAVRRRFAFVSLWPSMEAVSRHGCALSEEAFRKLVSIFIEHASEDALPLVPGHSYFLVREEEAAPGHLRTTLAPLLREYLAQGYVTGFAESIRGYLQWLESRQR